MFSYSGDPSASDLDAVRFHIGDTDSSDPLITDEEINYTLITYTVYFAAATCCEAIAAKFSRKADKEVDDLRIKWSQLSKQYLALGAKLRSLGDSTALTNMTPYAGGISVSDKDTVQEDTDRVPPSFTVGMNDAN